MVREEVKHPVVEFLVTPEGKFDRFIRVTDVDTVDMSSVPEQMREQMQKMVMEQVKAGKHMLPIFSSLLLLVVVMVLLLLFLLLYINS